MVNNAHKPVLIVIAGPNGSGKTTITHRILRHEWMEGALFMNCDSLKEVYCFAEKAPLIVPRVFEGTPIEKATLYVPEASIEEYKSNETWGRFKEIKPIHIQP